MAMDAVRLDQPPAQPPQVSSQMGAGAENPMQGIGQMLEKKEGPADFASMAKTHPQGALITRVEAVQKVLNETARMDQTMAPYCQRAIEILRSGLGEALKMQKAGVVAPSPDAGAGAAESNKPPSGESGRGFIG
jgi:hypothetical protein